MYNCAVGLTNAGIRIAALFSKKIAAMREGRLETLDVVGKAIEGVDQSRERIWVHCASLGEFEQGRPLIERIKKDNPKTFIALSFFSPSGYKVRKNYELADVVFYLPSDRKKNMKRLVEVLQPDKVFIVKYELWFNMLKALKDRGVRTFLFSALFQPKMSFFKWYGGFFRRMLGMFETIFVQDEASAKLLCGIGFCDNVVVAGDTRFDRVVENREAAQEVNWVKQFVRNANQVVICGSTWNADMDVLIPYILKHKESKFIIAPHNIIEEEIASIEAALMARGVLRYTKTTKYDNCECPNVMIIDCVGILNSVYRYGNRAYIGGGFGVGIHNVLEAAVWGLPLAFGPNYKRFAEAVDLVNLNCARSIENCEELERASVYFTEENLCAGMVSQEYVYSKRGASDTILKHVFGDSYVSN